MDMINTLINDVGICAYRLSSYAELSDTVISNENDMSSLFETIVILIKLYNKQVDSNGGKEVIIEKHTPVDGDYYFIKVDDYIFAKVWTYEDAIMIKDSLVLFQNSPVNHSNNEITLGNEDHG